MEAGRKRVTVTSPCASCGAEPPASISLGCVCVCTCERARVSVSENPPTAGMETSLVMHLPLLVAADSLGHPYIGRVCRLLPIVHPSHSARPPLSSALSFPPSSILHPPPEARLKRQEGTVRVHFKQENTKNRPSQKS